MYKVQVGFGPGDWDTHSVWPDRRRANEVCAALRGTIRIGRYPFPLPVRVKKMPDGRRMQRQISPPVVVSPPVLRKAVR